MSVMTCPTCKKEISSTTIKCPACGLSGEEKLAEGLRLAAQRKRVLVGSLVICLIGLPFGIFMRSPAVWGLAILGIIVAGAKLRAR